MGGREEREECSASLYAKIASLINLVPQHLCCNPGALVRLQGVELMVLWVYISLQNTALMVYATLVNKQQVSRPSYLSYIKLMQL